MKYIPTAALEALLVPTIPRMSAIRSRRGVKNGLESKVLVRIWYEYLVRTDTAGLNTLRGSHVATQDAFMEKMEWPPKAVRTVLRGQRDQVRMLERLDTEPYTSLGSFLLNSIRLWKNSNITIIYGNRTLGKSAPGANMTNC